MSAEKRLMWHLRRGRRSRRSRVVDVRIVKEPYPHYQTVALGKNVRPLSRPMHRFIDIFLLLGCNHMAPADQGSSENSFISEWRLSPEPVSYEGGHEERHMVEKKITFHVCTFFLRYVHSLHMFRDTYFYGHNTEENGIDFLCSIILT